jgi:hypothetical protein
MCSGCKLTRDTVLSTPDFQHGGSQSQLSIVGYELNLLLKRIAGVSDSADLLEEGCLIQEYLSSAACRSDLL